MKILRSIKYVRPAIWGFLIFALFVAVLTLAKIFIPVIVAYNWEKKHENKRIAIEKNIHNEFQTHINNLTQIAVRALSDIKAISTDEQLSVESRIFNKINSYNLPSSYTLDIVDPQGNLVAWNGASITNDYKKIIVADTSEKFIRVIQSGLKTYLVLGVLISKQKGYLIVSELIELNSPITNRYIERVSFSDNLSKKLQVKVILKTNQQDEINSEGYIVQLTDFNNNTIAECFVNSGSLISEIEKINLIVDDLISISLSMAGLLIAIFTALWLKTNKRGIVFNISIVAIIWILRIIWRQLNFPANILGGWMFNPNLFASPFVFGLSSSLGDLTISITAILISSIILFYTFLLKAPKEYPSATKIPNALVILFNGVVIIICLWFFRGFAEAIRSFVFDSTVQFNNPSEILFTKEAAVIYINILMLGVSLICLSMIMIWRIRIKLPQLYKIRILVLYTIIIVVSFIIFLIIDKTPFNVLICAAFFVLYVVAITEYYFKREKKEVDKFYLTRRIFISMLIASFLLGTALLNQRIRQKEQKVIETAAVDMLRPSDSWLTYILVDGLRITAASLSNLNSDSNLQFAKEKNLAFVQWSKTLLGKEGYNSSIVIYDKTGEELDRFVVGMSKLEQRELLTKVFEEEENSICFYEYASSGIGQLYGGWTTFRDQNGQLLGSVALLLSERNKNIFYSGDIDPLRQYDVIIENNISREIAINEYRNDSLIFSSGVKLFPEIKLADQIKKEFESSTNNKLWKDILVNGVWTNTLFVKDISAQERVLSVSVETLDFRWELFFYLKAFLITLIVLSVYPIVALWQYRKIPKLGFRGKLFLGFAGITLLPLIILSYYNKQIVVERVEQQIKSNLYRELKQLQDRIGIYIADEEDFKIGIDDDFCEALTAEYGMDFSVYRMNMLQASSRSELYRASIIDMRMKGDVYSAFFNDGKNFYATKEKIGLVEYYVGYAPIKFRNNILGIIAIPTLNRQKDIEAESAQRNAYVFSMYGIIFGIALFGGMLLSIRFTKPLHKLTEAAKGISDGNMKVNVEIKSNDEVGDLARTFNEMVVKLRASMIELAKHERENAWKEMAKQVAHEIKNPLTPIKLSIQHLKQVFKDKSPDREIILQRVTTTVTDQIDALSKIASEFSKFAKLPETKFEKFNINELLKETVNLFREVEGIVFIENLINTPIMILADRDQLRGVFVNIIRNAIQAIHKKGTITVVTSVDNKTCVIKFIDNGQGISEELLSKIFMPNFSTKTEGMGLGLAIAKRVIDDHGGTITCSSQSQRGTTFEIRLTI